jgi:hypothetical protein
MRSATPWKECLVVKRAKSWSEALKAHVEGKPVVILRLGESEWEALQESRRGVGEFTTAFPHADFSLVKAPTLCLLLAEVEDEHHAYLGLIGSRSPITTLQSRVKVKRAVKITPAAPEALVQLLDTPTHQRTFMERLAAGQGLTALSPKLSGELIDRLAAIEGNVGPMRTLASALSMPRQFRGNAALQEDAIRTAMKAFGLGSDDRADSLELVPDQESALARIPIIEDGAIEHDARSISGFDLVGSDKTGRAVFTRGRERLEIFTANRRQLERAFGVDLVYLNVTRRNLVMLQYKMLEPPTGKATDWTFVPDDQLDKELERMHRFARQNVAPQYEYRLNSATFYLKFVKRDGALRQGGIIMPIDHYDMFVQSPSARGPKGGLRVGYEALGGSYMREQPFLDLLRAGYIGAYADTTSKLMTLVKAVLDRGRAVVAAIQTSTEVSGETDELDDEIDL